MYADKRKGVGQFTAATPKDIENEYKKLTEDKTFIEMVKKVGGWDNMATTFDDHDYGINNGDKNYPYKLQSQQSFWDFNRVPAGSAVRRQNGVYSSKDFSIITNETVCESEGTENSTYCINQRRGSQFRYKVIMLDLRSNSGKVEFSSTSKRTENSEEGDFLGDEQWAWLEYEFDSDVDLIIIGSSIQLLPTDKLTEETWGAYPTARMRMLSLILNSKSPNVLVLSGDVHYAEVSKATCTWKETTNSVVAVSDDARSSSDSKGSSILSDSINKTSTLWELTSSGLTHTFSKASPFKMNRSSNNVVDPGHTIISDQFARNMVMDNKDRFPTLKGFLYNIYQASFPAHYREQRYADHYQGFNFGVLDFNMEALDSNVDNPFQKVVSSVTFRAMDHHSQAMITKNIPLKLRNNAKIIKQMDVTRHDIMCSPLWGPVPMWRMSLTYIMVFFPILLLLIPFIFFLFICNYLMKSVLSYFKKVS